MANYPLATSTWDQEEINAIQRVIESDMYTMGPYVAAYEKAFAEYFGVQHAVMVSSGSTANLIMIASLFFTQPPKLQEGDVVIVPSVSWSTTYFPLQQYGLKIKFVDINRETLNIDLDKLEKAICEKTKAILLVNLLGNPNNYDEISRIVGDRDIFVLEDNCESMGARFKGVMSGSYGLMGTFSSFFSHHISTMEGGCVVTDNEELYHVLLAVRAHGWTRNLPKENLVSGTKSDHPFEESFKFILPGYNARPIEMCGAIGLEQLKKLPRFVEARRNNAEHFKQLFSDHSSVQIQRETGNSSWFGFSLVVREGAGFDRSALVRVLQENGIECRPIVSGNFLKNMDVLKYFNYEVAGSVNAAEYIDINGLFVGNYQVDLRSEIDLLFNVVNKLGNTC